MKGSDRPRRPSRTARGESMYPVLLKQSSAGFAVLRNSPPEYMLSPLEAVLTAAMRANAQTSDTLA